MNLFDAAKPKRHFFDVGANIGQTFRDYLNPHLEFDGWDVWCFEPSPRHLAELLGTAKEQCDRYSIHVCPFGLGGSTHIRAFHVKDDPRGDSFEHQLGGTQNLSEGYALHAASISAGAFILDNTDFDDEIVLKLDCEGSEYNILNQLLYEPNAIKRIRQILVEWHQIGIRPAYSAQELSDLYGRAGKPLGQWMF